MVLDGTQPAIPGMWPVVTNGMSAFVARWSVANRGSIVCELYGHQVPREVLDVDDQTTVVAFLFFPFALTPTFNVSAESLRKGKLNLLDWDATRLSTLSRDLDIHDSILKKVEVLEDFLTDQVNRQRRACELVRYATDAIMYHPTAEILTEVVQHLAMTERSFQRVFKKYVGITAAHYRKICQFDQSFLQVRSRDFQQLSDIAYANGFSDQSHFNRTFKEFTATTPGEYLDSGLKT